MNIYKKALKNIYNLCSFDWDSMPEHLRKRANELTLEIVDEALKIPLRKRSPCWFGRCKYQFIRLEKYIDTSYGKRVPSTCIIERCVKCNNIHIKHYYGERLEEEDFSCI